MSFQDFLSKLSPADAKKIETAATRKLEKIPVASRRLTLALDGGIGRGRITTIYGNFSAGKTMLTLQSMAMWQEMGLTCGFIDCEKTFDAAFAEKLGVNTDELIVDGSQSSGRVESILTPWLKAGIDVVAIDSISHIMPEVFVDEKTGELSGSRKQIGQHAKAISNLINGIHYHNENTAVILLSQTTTDLSGMHPEQKPHGGNKVEFGSSTMIRLTSSNSDAKQKKGFVYKAGVKQELPIGRTVTAFTKKNKAGPQHRTATYDIYYDGDFVGVDSVGELVDLSIEYGVLNQGGSWIKLDEERKWQGRDNLVKIVRSDTELEHELETKLNGVLSNG